MTNLFVWGVDNRISATVTTKDPKDFLLLTWRGEIWKQQGPVELALVPDPKNRALTDFPYTGLDQPCLLSARALEVLGQFLESKGSLTECAIEGASMPYYAFSPRCVVDVIDEAMSQFKETTRLRFIHRAAFKDVEIAPTDVFVAKGFEQQYVWVTDAFVKAVVDARLVGAEFDDLTV